MTEYPQRIRDLRTARRMTQAQLARETGVTQQQIANVERKRKNPSAQLVVRIALALGLDPMRELRLSGALENKKRGLPTTKSQSARETRSSKA